MPHHAACRKSISTLLAAAGLCVALAACHRAPRVPAGDVGATLALDQLDGTLYDPSALRGKPALVTFWRPGCPYCAEALPKDQQAAQRAGATAIAVMVSGKNDDGTAELAKLGWEGTSLVDTELLVKRLDVEHVPYTLVLRIDGTVARVFDGDEASVDDLVAALDAAAK